MSYKMKKTLAVLLAAALGCNVAACSSDSSKSDVENTQSSETASTSEDGKIVTSQLDTSDMFSDRDKEIGYDETQSVSIELADNGITATADSVEITDSVVTIKDEGTYILTGALSDGQVVVDADSKKVQLVLNGVDITSKSSASIYVKVADKVFITLADKSENNIDGAIFSKDDITLNGEGTLAVTSQAGNAITSKNDLKVTSGTYTLKAAGHGLEAKDSIRVAGGEISITSGKDGLHSENSDESDKGYVYIAGGNIDITSEGDGIDASYIVQIDSGKMKIVSGGGSANASAHTQQQPQGGGQRRGRPTDDQNSADGQPAPDGQTPPDGQTSPDGQMPPDGVNPAEGQTTLSAQQVQDGDTQENSEKEENNNTEDTVSTKGIKSDSVIFLNNGELDIDSVDDGIHANGSIEVADGTYAIAAGDDGIHADEVLLISGADIDITKSYEGLEGKTITINDGDINIVSSDDGLNAAEGSTSDSMRSASSENCWIEINGGSLYVNADGDGIDSNGNMTINAGDIKVDGPSNSGNAALDFGDGANAYINGGNLIAVGGSGMVEAFDSSSKQAMMSVQVADSNITGEVVLSDSDGNVIISYTPAKEYNCVQISTAELEKGKTYTLKAGDTTTTIELNELLYSNISNNGNKGRGGKSFPRTT